MLNIILTTFFFHHGQLYYQHVSSNFAIDSLFLDEIRVHYSNESYDRLKLTFRISFLLVTEQKVFELSKTIYNFQEGPSIPWAHPCPGSIYPEGPWGPSMPRAHPCPAPIHPEGPWWTIHAQTPFIPRALACPGFNMPRSHATPSLPRAHPIPRAHGPIHAQLLSMPTAHTCPEHIHPEGPWGPILA